MDVPRKPGRKPRVLLSFPDSAAPVAMDAARDGSLYLDLLRDQFVLMRVNESSGAGEEFGLPTKDFLTMVSPGGDVMVTLTGWGGRRLAAVRPGGAAAGIGGNLRRHHASRRRHSAATWLS